MVLRKQTVRTTDGRKKKEADFVVKLKDLFDFPHEDTSKLIKTSENMLSPCSKGDGRLGVMGSVDNVLATKETLVKERDTTGEKRRRKEHTEQEPSTITASWVLRCLAPL